MTLSTPPERLDPTYVAARRVLLDALTALVPHGPAVIVAGAQAVYLHTGSADLAIAPYTTDGDLAIDPQRLAVVPELASAMVAAGLEPAREPGIWHAWAQVDGRDVRIPVDLIVPEHAAPPGGRRGARLGVHGNRAARRAVGLEAALVDHAPMTVAALDPSDARSVDAEVAGEAALLVAKLHKINDRVQSRRSDRIDDKDAADVLRLMQSVAPERIGETFVRLLDDSIAGAVTSEAVRLLEALFGRAGRPGVRMAARALRLAMDEEQVEALCIAYARELVRLTHPAI